MKLRTGFVVLLAFVVPLLAAALFCAADPLFQSALRRFGPRVLGQPLDLEDASLDLVRGRAEIQGLRAGTAERPLLQAGRIALEATPWQILSGRFRIQEAALDDATLHLVVDQEGRLGFDPGPPPQTEPRRRPQPRPKELPPPPERDFVQIVAEYWERIQDYREYYERVGVLRGAEDEGGIERAARPGQPAFLPPTPPGSGFWIGHAGLRNLRWETRDERTGQPILPAVRSFSLTVDRLGDAPSGAVEPAVIAGGGELAGGGSVEFALALSRGGAPNGLRLRARGVPTASLTHLATKSLPWELRGGLLDLRADDLRFTADELSGRVELTLRETRLRARPGAPDVLGVDAAEFARILNDGLQQAPVRILLRLAGTPTRPRFAVENASSPAELVAAALRAQAEGKLREAAQEKAQELLGEDLRGLLPGADREQKEHRRERRRAEEPSAPPR